VRKLHMMLAREECDQEIVRVEMSDYNEGE
jgi:hypothetical protein